MTADGSEGLDGLLGSLGGFGKYQIFSMACLSCMILLCSIGEWGYIMTAGTVKHRCYIPECEAMNSSYADQDKPWMIRAIPKSDSSGYDSCMRYAPSSASCDELLPSNETTKCNIFIYETPERTIVREDWDIHCDSDQYKLSLVGSVNLAGQVIGGLYVGLLQDRLGRKRVLVALTTLVSVIGVLKSFSKTYGMFLALEFIESNAVVALYNGPVVVAMEIVDPTKRVLAGFIANLTYMFGQIILGTVQFSTFNWRYTLRFCYLPFLIALSFYWILPESIKWLLNHGKAKEAHDVLKKLAKMNGAEFPEERVEKVLKYELDKAKEEDTHSWGRMLEVFQSPLLRWRTVFTILAWTTSVFAYLGITMHSVDIGSNKFSDFMLSALVEFPAVLIVFLTMDRIGRKPTQSCHLALCFAACLLHAYMPQDWENTRLAIYLVGKIGASGACANVCIYIAEMFPTFIRSTIISMAVTGGKIAAVLAPQLKLLESLYKPLPLLVFSFMAFVGLCCTLPLPETMGCKLPDTVKEAEEMTTFTPEREKHSTHF